MPKRFDLIVFDWDGTLADSTGMIVDCLREASADAGLPVPEPSAASNIIGLGLREAVNILFGELGERDFTVLTTRYRHHYYARDAQTPLFDGVFDAVTALAGCGFKLAIATGKGRNGLNLSLQHTGLASYFQATRSVDECRSKPHPQMLLELMDILESEPARTLMIGDSSFDLQMAQNASVASLAVTYGAQPLANLLPYAPLAHFNQFSGLNQWLVANA